MVAAWWCLAAVQAILDCHWHALEDGLKNPVLDRQIIDGQMLNMMVLLCREHQKA